MRICHVLLISACLGCASPAASSAARAAGNGALPVEFVTVEAKPLSSQRVLTGTVEAAETVSVGFETGGRIVSLDVAAGDRVKAGDTIATLDATQQEAAKRSASAALDGAEAALSQAQDDYARQTGLLKKGVVTKATAEAAERAQVVAQSAVDNARTQLSKAETALQRTVVKAETDSIVTETEAEVGQIVGAGQGVATLASENSRDAVFLVPDGSQPERFLGQEVIITSLDRAGVTTRARLSEVSPIVDQRTGSIRVKARLEDTGENRFSLGAVIEGEVTVPGGSALVLPWDTLTSTADGMAVWVVDPHTSRARLAPVVVARFSTDAAVISDGLSPGDIVVGAGSQLLYPDRPVVDSAKAGQE